MGMHRGKCIAAADSFVHVCWRDSRDGNLEIYYKRSTDNGLSWEEDVRMTNSPDSSSSPILAVSGNYVYLFYIDKIDGNFDVYFRLSSNKGESWGDVFRVLESPGISGVPNIAVDGSEIHLVWREVVNGNYETFYTKSSDQGDSWSQEVNLSNDMPMSYNQCIAKLGNKIFVIWERAGSPSINLFDISTDNGDTWSASPSALNEYYSRNLPQLFSSDNKLYYVWNDFKNGNWEIYSIYYDITNDKWSDEMRLSNASGNSMWPSVTASGNDIYVFWQDDRNANNEIFYQHSSDLGKTWSGETLLTDNNGTMSQRPNVAISGESVHVVWMDNRDGPNSEIYYKRNPKGVVLSCEEQQIQNPALCLFPNPASDFIKIDMKFENCNYSIIDLTGVILKSGQISGNRIEVSELPSGVYLLKMNYLKNIETQMFLKNK